MSSNRKQKAIELRAKNSYDLGSHAVEREAALRELLRGMRGAVVAYSGGVDSAVLLAVAVQEVRGETLAITGRSPSVALGEVDRASILAAGMGARHQIIETREFEDPRYRENSPDRCFYCKDELYSRLWQIARERGYENVLDGFNADDGKSPLDRRPGHDAGLRLGVRSPLAEVGLTKDDVRSIARRLNLAVWDKPATPCLSSRIPYGTRVEEETLRKIDLAECYLRARGYRIVRVRHFGNAARIEVPPADIARLQAARAGIERVLQSVGYDRIEVDPRGYRRGSLNDSAAS
ncbi:MAG: ATP-dependent sacrificial sulfur transferase LarE [Candidatus Eremiobacteraeota bacterium]|nr:ATP-dependent sacrificial sulfur transferase LarE [Candidatus Eremiobacteraeota bacterium]